MGAHGRWWGQSLWSPANCSSTLRAAEGIRSIATVHDSFGCLAAQAERFRRIIREQVVALYKEHDVLQEVLDEARRDLKDPTDLPDKPPEGVLNIEQVLEAEYTFA